MTRKQEQFTVFSYSAECGEKLKNAATPIIPTNMNELAVTIGNCITTGNSVRLETLLNDKFIYPGNGLKEGDTDKSNKYFPYSSEAYNDYEGTYRGDHHVRHFRYEYYYTQPIMVTLFFEYNKLFQNIINRLAQSNNAELHRVFTSVFARYPELPQEIFELCDANLKNNLQSAVQSIKAYSAELESKGIDKFRLVNNIANQTDAVVNGMPIYLNATPTAQIRSLDFKFNYLKALYSEPTISTHRDSKWGHLAANISSILFSAAILNVINYAVTGNFFFFNQTDSQTKVNHASATLPHRNLLTR